MVPMTNEARPAFFRPASQAGATRSLLDRRPASGSSRPMSCSLPRIRPRNSSLRFALPCASITEWVPTPPASSGSRRSQSNTRLNIALLVAWVGSAIKQPPAPLLAANTSATSRAASVLPSPIGASMTSRPGSPTSLASSMAATCKGRGSACSGRPNRAAKAGSGSLATARQGAGNARLCHASSARFSWGSALS